MRIAFLVLLSFAAGCTGQVTQGTYTRQGGGEQEQFMQDRAQCARQATEQRAGSTSNGYGGAAESGTIVSCAKWLSCMNDRHYQADAKGNLHAGWASAVPCTN